MKKTTRRVGHLAGILCIMIISIIGNHQARTEGKMEKATFAGGCFWCMEAPFEKKHGVSRVVSGYTGGWKQDPGYEEVSLGSTGHLEAVQITYDPSLVKYTELLDIFWAQIDPTDDGGQFSDRGSQYRTAVFYHNEYQKALAEESKRKLELSGLYNDPIVTRILPAGKFYPAEDYHQNYYKTNPIRYKLYREGSGREQYIDRIRRKIEELEGSDRSESSQIDRYHKPEISVLKKRLTPIQFHVTQENGTEPPFDNAYWNNKADGIYVDIVSGEPLFSSRDKYDSGTGWPSFTKPLVPSHIVERRDTSLFIERLEVRSKWGDSHLGHVFPDGPGGRRYCINSASLRFIPVAKMAETGYGKYLSSFSE